MVDDALDEVDRDADRDAIGNPQGSESTPAIGTATASTDIIDNDATTSISIAADAPVGRRGRRHHHLHGDPHRRCRGLADRRLHAHRRVEAADFQPARRGTVTFAQGETVKTITVTVVDDALDEVDRDADRDARRTRRAARSTPAIGTAAASTDISTTTPATSISIAADAPSVDEAAGTITFTVTRTGDAEGTQTVDYTLTGDSQAGDISSPFSGTVTFAAGRDRQDHHRHRCRRRARRGDRDASPSTLVEPAGQRR